MTNLWYLNARRYSFLVECYARSTLRGQLAPIVVCAWCYLGHIDMVRCMVILEDKHWKACLLCMPVLLCAATTNMPYQTVFNHRCTRSLVNYLVTSHIDYCNSLLNGIPKTTLNKLHKCSKHCHQTNQQDLPPQPHHSRVKGSTLATDSIPDSVLNTCVSI